MIITVAHQKGGTGKSTIATNIASFLGADILDLDKQHSSTIWNHVRGLTKQDGGANKERLRLVTLKNSRCELDSQTALPDNSLDDFLNAYKEDPEALLVVDTGGFDSVTNRKVIAMANIVLTPVAPSGIEIFGLQMFEKTLLEAKKIIGKTIPCYVVLNNINTSSKLRLEDVLNFIKGKDTFNLMKQRLSRRIAYQKAYEEGKNVIELSARSKAAEEIIDLVTEIKRILRKND